MRDRILIVTPVDGGDVMTARVTAGYAEHVRHVSAMYSAEALPSSLFFTTDIVRARNRAAAMALSVDGWDRLLWWDDDVLLGNYGLIGKMLEIDVDMIAAPDTTKGDDPRWVHTLHPNQIPVLDDRQCLSVRSVGFGFTMTSRSMLETMSLSARKYRDVRRDGSPKIANIFGQLYERIVDDWKDEEDDTLMSEDYSFCKRWREIYGGHIWIYGGPGNLLGHVGARAFDLRDMR
jgi:hypothetical protein